jgi:AraC family transcriptional activator of pobA
LREHATRRGSIFFISPMTPHQVRFDTGASLFIIYFDLAYIRPDLDYPEAEIDVELLARVPELAPFVYQSELDFMLADRSLITIQHYCAQMLVEQATNRLCSEEVIRSHLILLLSEVTQNYEPQIMSLMKTRPPSGGAERHVKGVIRFINNNFKRRISLADAAESVAVSPNYLASLLKRETGKSFVELVTERRIERAGELLVFTNNRISRVAEETGFADLDYFARRFKQITGFTPSEFRLIHALDSELH